MNVLPIEYLTAKFGIPTKERVANADIYNQKDPDVRYGPSLDELLYEFAKVNANPDHLKQALNPRTNEWTIIDTLQGTVIGSFKEQLPNIEVASKKSTL